MPTEEENLRKLNANFNTLRTLSSILDDNRIFGETFLSIFCS